MWKSRIAIAMLVVTASVVSGSARADVIDFNALTEGEIVSSVSGSGGGGPVAVFGNAVSAAGRLGFMLPRRDDRAVEGARLESACALGHRGFESHSLRQFARLPAPIRGAPSTSRP